MTKAYTTTVEAIQLLWSNWSDICTFAKVGSLTENQPEGCFIDKNGDPLPKNYASPNGTLGLQIPTKRGLLIGIEGDWLIKDQFGNLSFCESHLFKQIYKEVI